MPQKNPGWKNLAGGYFLCLRMRRKLMKTGAKVVEYPSYLVFQLTKLALPRVLFEQILTRIRGPCAVATRPGPEEVPVSRLRRL
jgi:hypothetical protein